MRVSQGGFHDMERLCDGKTATSLEKKGRGPRQKSGISRLLEIAMMKKRLMAAAISLAILSTIASFIPYAAIYLVIKEIVYVYPTIANLSTRTVHMYATLALAGVFISIILYMLSVAFSHIAAYGTLYQLKMDFLRHLARVPLGFILKTGTGKLREVMDDSIESLEGFIAHDLTNMVSAFTAPILMIVTVLAVDWRFGLVSLLGIVVAFVLYGATSAGKQTGQMITDYQSALGDMSNASTEYVRGMGVIKAFQQTADSFNRLRSSIGRYTKAVTTYSLSQENMTATLTTAFSSMYLILIPAGILMGRRAADYRGFVSSFIFYLIFVPVIGGILMKVIYAMANTQQFLGAAERMDSVLGETTMTENGRHACPEGFALSFDNVSFSYDESSTQRALSHITFTVPEKQTTAIVGVSGGGKTTIASLIPRFYDVDEGAITIGGVDIRDMDVDDLMETVSFVFQDTFLFGETIFENIRMGRKGASRDDVVTAAKAAQCHEFICELPAGYDTVYGSSGAQLSGGEAQRLAIARAIVKNSPVLVLDEATAFSDAENEYLIQKALDELMRDKTVIMIAHRLSTIRNADSILVVERGSIVERGTFEQLITAKGQFSNLWECYTHSTAWKLRGGETA